MRFDILRPFEILSLIIKSVFTFGRKNAYHIMQRLIYLLIMNAEARYDLDVDTGLDSRLNKDLVWQRLSSQILFNCFKVFSLPSRYGSDRNRSFKLSQTCGELVENAVEVPTSKVSRLYPLLRDDTFHGWGLNLLASNILAMFQECNKFIIQFHSMEKMLVIQF